MRVASPSIIAVFPTPGTPTKTGLFFVLFAIQKMAYLSQKIHFIQEVGKFER